MVVSWNGGGAWNRWGEEGSAHWECLETQDSWKASRVVRGHLAAALCRVTESIQTRNVGERLQNRSSACEVPAKKSARTTTTTNHEGTGASGSRAEGTWVHEARRVRPRLPQARGLLARLGLIPGSLLTCFEAEVCLSAGALGLRFASTRRRVA
ncbi:hypothetical protein NDU88_008243 [Pleurodeles waltl]|uniref:Uncharacterized protein n=1 Tax=Pleurodeles waltl TaxID=8319 RepID=A0AAV7NVG5_PLEWA|nr:hypothetical protein NDU88_008243 [Pleurodeles waltl]